MVEARSARIAGNLIERDPEAFLEILKKSRPRDVNIIGISFFSSYFFSLVFIF